MRKYLVVAAAAAMVAGCAQQSGNGASAEVNLDAESARFSYAVGVDIANSLQAVRDEIDAAALQRGIEDALTEQELALDDEARSEVKNSVSQRLQAQRQAEREQLGARNAEAGAAFLAENGAREGVVTTESGLQYEELEAGSGASPTAENSVTVHYRGTLIDGTEFDSSYERGEPITFPLGNVIAGWTEGLQMMKVGGKSKLYIPSELAYGAGGIGDRIGPNSTLIFEVELLEVE